MEEEELFDVNPAATFYGLTMMALSMSALSRS